MIGYCCVKNLLGEGVINLRPIYRRRWVGSGDRRAVKSDAVWRWVIDPPFKLAGAFGSAAGGRCPGNARITGSIRSADRRLGVKCGQTRSGRAGERPKIKECTFHVYLLLIGEFN